MERDPTIVFSDPYLYIFAPGTNHKFYFSRNDTTGGFDPSNWTWWAVIPNGVLESEAGVAAQSGKTLFVAALATDARYYYAKTQDGGENWSDWLPLHFGGLTFLSAPAR